MFVGPWEALVEKENCVEEKGGQLLSELAFVRAQTFVCDREEAMGAGGRWDA